MKNEIKVPSMGESISQAIIGQILVTNGSVVKADTELLEIETDKVNQVLYAPHGGKVTLSVKSGDTVKIGQIIGSIESSSEIEIESTKVQQTPIVGSLPQSSLQLETISLKVNEKNEKERVLGKAIRITKDDFLAQLNHPQREVLASSAKIEVPHQPSLEKTGLRETRRPMSKIRKVIAERLVEAKRTMAMLTTFNEVDLTEVIVLREKYKEAFFKKFGSKLGLMSFFVKATVSALQEFPNLNSYIDEDEIVHREYYDIGVAVGTEKGVIVPVLRNCQDLSFADIEKNIEDFAKRAKDSKLVAHDLQGGGFTITNGGIYGSLLSTPILLPPQCGILGMHKIEKRAVVIDDQIVIRSMMYVALSYDHRLIDGKEAVSFLVHIKNMLEEPSRLVLNI